MTLPNPTTAPTIVSGVSGAIYGGSTPTGVYNLGYTYTDNFDESDISPLATVTLATDHPNIDVTALGTLPGGVTGVNWYVSETAGSSQLLFYLPNAGEAHTVSVPRYLFNSYGPQPQPLPNSGVIPGNYTNSNITVTSKGIIKAISNGSGGGSGASLPSWQTYTNPTTNTWAWVNQGSATRINQTDAITISTPANASDDNKMLVKSTPSTPYVIEAFFLPLLVPYKYSQAGLVWRESSSGKIVTAHFTWGLSTTDTLSFAVTKWGSPTIFTAHYIEIVSSTWFSPIGCWLKLADNGTNRTVSVSSDGLNWIVIHSISRTDFLTPDQVGYVVSSSNGTLGSGITLANWKES